MWGWNETKRKSMQYLCAHSSQGFLTGGKGKSVECMLFPLLHRVICTTICYCTLSYADLSASSSMTLTLPILLH